MVIMGVGISIDIAKSKRTPLPPEKVRAHKRTPTFIGMLTRHRQRFAVTPPLSDPGSDGLHAAAAHGDAADPSDADDAAAAAAATVPAPAATAAGAPRVAAHVRPGGSEVLLQPNHRAERVPVLRADDCARGGILRRCLLPGGVAERGR